MNSVQINFGNSKLISTGKEPVAIGDCQICEADVIEETLEFSSTTSDYQLLTVDSGGYLYHYWASRCRGEMHERSITYIFILNV